MAPINVFSFAFLAANGLILSVQYTETLGV